MRHGLEMQKAGAKSRLREVAQFAKVPWTGAVEVFDFGYKDEGISMSNNSKMSSINITNRILTLLRTHTTLTFLIAGKLSR